MVTSGVNGAQSLAADLLTAAAAVKAGSTAVTVAAAGEILAGTKSRAPRASGDYAGSWKSERKTLPDGVQVSLYTEDPAAARLEYGFHGRDSRGRVYEQAPRSHQRAAIDAVYPQIKAALVALTQNAVRG